MKRKFIVIALAAMILGGGVSSCKKKEGCTDEKATNYDPDAEKDDGSCQVDTASFKEIAGEKYYIVPASIAQNYILTSGKKWLLTGGVKVQEGATISIEAGTKIFADDNAATPFLSIQRGGKIMATGTAQLPIVFTSILAVTAPGSLDRGLWGGIVVNGRARINIAAEAEGEGGTGTYGGTDDTDNSGVIQYVRVEYAGKLLGTDNELNGFSFNGVGSGTVVDHIQAHMGGDDGIEFFGGTVSVKYAVSTGNKDDSFDWTHGWRGFGQFWVAQQSSTGGDRGIEGDNFDSDNSKEPFSSPTLSNITLVGAEDGDGKNVGVILREGTKGSINNMILTGFPGGGVEVKDSITVLNMEARSLSVANSNVFTNGTLNWKNCPVFETNGSNSIDPVTLNGVIGIVPSAFDPAGVNVWFLSASYKGAVDPNNNWMTGWTAGM